MSRKDKGVAVVLDYALDNRPSTGDGRPAVSTTRQAPVSSCRRRGAVEGGGSGVARSGSRIPGTKRRHVTPLMARTEPIPVSMKINAGKLAEWAAHRLGQRARELGRSAGPSREPPAYRCSRKGSLVPRLSPPKKRRLAHHSAVRDL